MRRGLADRDAVGAQSLEGRGRGAGEGGAAAAGIALTFRAFLARFGRRGAVRRPLRGAEGLARGADRGQRRAGRPLGGGLGRGGAAGFEVALGRQRPDHFLDDLAQILFVHDRSLRCTS